jgi:hypothetical protein
MNLNPNSHIAVIPAQAGIQPKNTLRSRLNLLSPRLRGGCSIIWIPACAGMTG